MESKNPKVKPEASEGGEVLVDYKRRDRLRVEDTPNRVTAVLGPDGLPVVANPTFINPQTAEWNEAVRTASAEGLLKDPIRI